MLKTTSAATPEALLAMAKEVLEQVKVLVAAVDDLRCEIEWRDHQGTAPQVEPRLALAQENPSMPARIHLAALERRFADGLPNRCPDLVDWTDAPEFSVGVVTTLSAPQWRAVLHTRHAHVVGEEDCSCEVDCGAPFLLAWQNAEGYFLRELSELEAVALQQACLAAQAESAELNRRPRRSAGFGKPSG